MGANICCELMEEFLQMFGVSHIKTSAYHPERDGMVECYNVTLKSRLCKYIERFGRQWHKSPYLLFGFCELPHPSKGVSPFELIYGQDPREPLDVLQEQWRKLPTSPSYSTPTRSWRQLLAWPAPLSWRRRTKLRPGISGQHMNTASRWMT